MEIVLFTVVAAALYFISDTVLKAVEYRRGAALPHRSLIFFALILGLALISFEVINRLLPGAGAVQ